MRVRAGAVIQSKKLLATASDDERGHINLFLHCLLVVDSVPVM